MPCRGQFSCLAPFGGVMARAPASQPHPSPHFPCPVKPYINTLPPALLFFFPATPFLFSIPPIILYSATRLFFFSRIFIQFHRSPSPSNMSLQNKLSIKDLDLKDKKVFIRVGTYSIAHHSDPC